jgi:hypothetical protein
MGVRLAVAGESAVGGRNRRDPSAGADEIVIAMLLAAAIAVADPFPAGKLCIDGLPCIATVTRLAQIAPATESRRFVWTADDRSVVAIGTVDAAATTVTLDAGTSRPLRISATAQTAVAFEIASGSSRWRWTVAKPPPAIRLIHPACPDCVLSAEADGFRKFEKPLRDVRDVVLHPWPRLRGRVVDRATNAPLSGATITAGEILIAKADANGLFDTPIEQQWPRAIDVQYPGRAPQRVTVPAAVADTELPAIALSTGGTLRATIEIPTPQKLTWELRDPASHDLLRQGTVEPSATLVVIDGIGAGKHSFVLRGARPLQQLATLVDIEPERVTEASISIEPGTLNLEVKRGSAPFAHAKATVGMLDERWEGELVLDEEGHASEELWQRGKMSAAIYRNGRAIALKIKEIHSEEETWQITVPDRRLTGTVTDATTGAALPDARVTLWIRTAESVGTVLAVADAEGRFVFDGVHEGTHELKAFRDGYVLAEGITVTIENADGDYTRDVRLRSRNAGRPLIVLDERGVPVADALVIVATVNGIREVGNTAIDGTASLPLGVAERAVVFAIPRSGSFGFTRVAPSTDGDATVALHVRAASASIDVRTHDPEGNPLADVLLVPRVDGLMLPVDVVDALQRVQGVSFFTDANGRARLSGMPRGVYELWAITGRDVMNAVRSPAPPPPNASLDVVSGRYEVTIGFTAEPATR